MRSGWRRRIGRERGRAVGGGQDREAGVLEVVARELDDRGFVIDDEDGLHVVRTHRGGMALMAGYPGRVADAAPGRRWPRAQGGEGKPAVRPGWREEEGCWCCRLSGRWFRGRSCPRWRATRDATPRTCRGSALGRPRPVRRRMVGTPTAGAAGTPAVAVSAAADVDPEQAEHEDQEDDRAQEAEEPEAEAGMEAPGGNDEGRRRSSRR